MKVLGEQDVICIGTIAAMFVVKMVNKIVYSILCLSPLQRLVGGHLLHLLLLVPLLILQPPEQETNQNSDMLISEVQNLATAALKCLLQKICYRIRVLTGPMEQWNPPTRRFVSLFTNDSGVERRPG